MKISGLNHFFFRPRDLSRSLRFYRDVLRLNCEFQGTSDHPELVIVRLGGGTNLVLGTPAHGGPTFPAGAPLFSISLHVEDPDVFARECQERGWPIAEPAHETHWGTRLFVLRDPDGITLHFERPTEQS
jgi:catechol 2,3-dioxygenase-like lactoylglutathione lyase family enzyme